MRLPRQIDLEVLDWFSRRRAVRRSSVPMAFRPAMRRMLADYALLGRGLAWLEPSDVVLVEITPVGRALAAAYRTGRAALQPGQMEIAS